MRKRTTGLILTGILATTGAGGAVALTPASATTSDNVVTSRLAGIKSALSGLVTDGTLTQAQADKVATTLDSKLPKHGLKHGLKHGTGGPGGHFGWMGMAQTHAAAAKALGLTTDELHNALQSGKNLAEVAKDQKVSVAVLVKAMVAATEAELATAVKEGAITKAQAEKMKSSLTQRITDRVNGVRSGHGHGNGHRKGNRGAQTSPSGDRSDATSSDATSSTSPAPAHLGTV